MTAEKTTLQASTSPTISVVIPAYNRAPELVEAVRSVLEQTLPPLEVLVVDDASTDGTEKIDFAAIDPRVRLIRHEKNQGGSKARNTGIDAARGDYVALLDSDDRWLPHKLATQVAALKAHPGDAPLVLASNVTVDRGELRFIHNRRGPRPDENIADYLMLSRGALQTSTLLLPTAFARKVRFRDGLKRCQDLDFLVRLQRAGAEMVYVDEPLTVYNQRSDPNRITRHPKGFEQTVDWYKVAKDMLPARAMQAFFVHSAMGRNWIHHPMATLKAFTWVAATSPGGIFRMGWLYLAMIARRVADRFAAPSEHLR